MVWTGTISSKGQLTIPKAVREALGLEPGTRVLFVLREGKVELEAVSGDIKRWQGALAGEEGRGPPQEMRDRVRRAIAEEVIREAQGH